MKTGKIPENILSRAVLKKLHTKRAEVVLGPSEGEDCAALELGQDELLITSVDSITYSSNDAGSLCVNKALNNVATAGAEPVGVLLNIFLPEKDREIRLREIMEQVEQECVKHNVQVLGGNTETTDAVNRILVSATGVGRVKKSEFLKTGDAKPGMDIVLTKWIALEGTSVIASDRREELITRLPSSLVDVAAGFKEYISVLPEAQIAKDHGAAAMHDVSSGGIFGALWEVGSAAGVGLTVDLKSIPVRQETIEVCEFFGINPYELMSGGSLLIISNDGEGLVGKLCDADIPAAVIGKINEGNDRVVISGDEKRFIEQHRIDALYTINKMEEA